jgi:pimeloyl-ACP methyl ester carboxylesterase
MQQTDTFITVNGKSIFIKHKEGYAGRPTLIFLHDSLGCVELWRDFPDKLADAVQCNVLVYDRVGYGKSAPMDTHERAIDYMEQEADVLHEMLQQLKIGDSILFGHSDGGSIALLAAAKYPERIKAVVCEAAHIFVEDVTLKGIRQAMEAYKDTDLKHRLQKYHDDKVETLFKAWTETWTRPDFLNWNIVHFLPSIMCPLLFIQGEADEYGTLKQLKKTVSGVTGRAQEYILAGIGHTPHKEAPDLVIDAAKIFIESIL